MIEQGFIKVHRSMLKWEWYDDIYTTRLFIHLLLTANYDERSWRGVVVKRGQRVCSYDTLSKETGLSVRSIRTALKRLESTGEVTKQSNAQYSIITANNYDKYQGATDETTSERQSSDKQATSERQASDNNERKIKKDKKDKKDKEEYVRGFDNAFEDFKEMRKKIRAPLTERAEQLIHDKLNRLSGGNEQSKIAILNQSIERGWRGVFEIKETENEQSGRNNEINPKPNLDFTKLPAGVLRMQLLQRDGMGSSD